jgi:putative ABC transport system permease protein
MLFFYFKQGWRNLFRHKAVNALQIIGLGIGLAGSILLAQYVFFESSFDIQNSNRNNLYRVCANIYREGVLDVSSSVTYLDLGPSLQADYPEEVEAYTRLVNMAGQIQIDNKTFLEPRVIYADASLPRLFDLKMLHGDRNSALQDPGTLILSEAAAQQFFGTTDCLGKTIQFQSMFPQKLYEVRGVYEDLPSNTHLQSRFFLSISSLTQTPGVLEKWAWRDFPNYILLKPGTADQFAKKIARSDYVGAHYPAFPERQIRHELFLQRVADIHLLPRLSLEYAVVGNAKTVKNLSFLGVFLLLVSTLNFVLLALAKASERSKEMGIRKTIGANRRGLLEQALLENLPILIVASGLALVLIVAAQPSLRTLTESDLPFTFLANPRLLGIALLIFGGIIVGGNLLPALAMTRFAPISLLKTTQLQPKTRRQWSRKFIVVFQFSLAVFMIIATFTIWQQIQFLLHRDIGLNMDQTLVLQVPNDRSAALAAQMSALKKALLQNTQIRSVTHSFSVPGDAGPWVPSIRKFSAGEGVGASRIISLNAVDGDFFEAYGMKILAGRNFRQGAAPERDALVFTEKAAKALGFQKPEEALGQRFICAGDTVTVVGIVSAYAETGGQSLPGDFMFVQRTDEYNRISIKVKAEDVQASIKAIETTWKEIFKGADLNYFFLDQHFAQLFTAEMRFGKIAGILSALTILIACMGLLGILMLSIGKRIKEIGIRKVLGASALGILGLISRDFLKLVLVAILIASPLAYYAMQQWLQDFAYRIELQWWFFVVAGASALCLAFLMVALQSIRAIQANPVQSLRNE